MRGSILEACLGPSPHWLDGEKVSDPTTRTFALANEVIKVCRELGIVACPARVELFLYFASGWYLAIHERVLITEQIFAADAGPEIRSLRAEFPRWEGSEIVGLIKSLDVISGTVSPVRLAGDDLETIRAFLRVCCRAFRKASVEELKKLACMTGSPWEVARAGVPAEVVPVIHPETMERHFIVMAQDLSQAGRKSSR